MTTPPVDNQGQPITIAWTTEVQYSVTLGIDEISRRLREDGSTDVPPSGFATVDELRAFWEDNMALEDWLFDLEDPDAEGVDVHPSTQSRVIESISLAAKD